MYDEVNVLLHHMAELYEARGTNTRALTVARKRYLNWVEKRKAEYNRHRSWKYADLDAELAALCRATRTPNGAAVPPQSSGDSLETVMGNTKLAAFITDVVLHRKTLDYVTLKLSTG